jgi:uncharacterized membrane protein
MVQGAVLMVALLGAPTFMRAALLPASDAGLFRLAVTGASLQLINLLEILLLYYFDLRREALIVSLALFLGEVALVTAAHVAGLPPAAGYALACALAAAVGLGYVRVRLASLLDDTFQSQPFGDAV